MPQQGKKKAEKVIMRYVMYCKLCNKKFLHGMTFTKYKGWETPSCPWCGLSTPVMFIEARMKQYA